MAVPKLEDLLALDVRTRLALAEELWNSVVNDEQSLPVTAAERAELDSRLREDDENPDAAISWADARARLRGDPNLWPDR